MPCQQCEDGMWKWGETGECRYSSREACEADNAGEAEGEGAQARRPRRALDLALRSSWAITPDGLRTVLQVADRQGDPEAVAQRLGERVDSDEGRTSLVRRGSAAVLPITGPIFRYANLFTMISGASSVEVLARDFQTALDDPETESIVLEINSPGGQVTGIHELAEQIAAARGIKPVTAYVGGMGASAAYWLASAADAIVADATAELGSIGVVATYVDASDAQRAAGIEEIEIVSSGSPKKRTNPRSDEGRAQIQTRVDAMEAVFVADVARNRGVSEATVRHDFGQGALLVGQAAVDAGLADRLGNLEGVIAESQATETIVTEGLTMTGQASKTHQAADAQPTIAPGTDGQPVTAAELAQAYPEAAEALRAEGATAERERIQAVEAQALPGHEALIDQLRLDGQTTGEQAAVQVLKAERERSAGVRQATLAEGAELDQVPGTHSATGEVETSRSAGPAPDAPLADRIQAEWEADPVLAQEFSSFEAYQAYREAEERGQVAKAS